MKKDQDKTREELINELSELRNLLKNGQTSITKLKTEKDQVQKAKGYAENVIETLRESLLVLDANLKIICANHSFYRTFNVKPAETVGSYIYDLGNNQWDIPRLRILLEKILPKNTNFNDFEVEHNFPSIGHKIMLLNARQIYREKDEGMMILLAIEDVTELRRSERDKRNILSMFAHDMKNPLVTSEGFLLRIISGKAGVLTEKQQEYLKIIFSEIDKVLKLIAEFLDFSRYEAKMYTPSLAQVDMRVEIQKNIEAEKLEAEKKQITLSFEPKDVVLPMVNADATMINRVIRNILDNAIKNTPNGGTIAVTVTDRGKEILVSIKDTGTGIPKDHLLHIFDPFYRVARDSKGSGLGLSIARTIVELHGGRIWAQNTPPEGCTFNFTLLKR